MEIDDKNILSVISSFKAALPAHASAVSVVLSPEMWRALHAAVERERSESAVYKHSSLNGSEIKEIFGLVVVLDHDATAPVTLGVSTHALSR